MLEAFGVPLGTIFQGGTLVAMLTLLAIVGRAWIVGIPERLRVANEGKALATTELAERYGAWRLEVHDLKNELAVVAANQAKCDKALVDALGTIRHNIADKNTLLFIVRIQNRELERKEPDNVIVQQAKDMLHQLGEQPFSDDKSTALATAEHTVEAAKVVVEEVKQAESDEAEK